MPVAYFLVLLTSFLFSRNHFPFANTLILLSLVLLLADVIAQLVRFLIRRVPLKTFLGAVALLFLGIGFAFTWMFWLGAEVTAIFGLIAAVAFIVYWLKINARPSLRFLVVLFMTVSVGVLVTMRTSSVYCFKHAIDREKPMAPVHQTYFLAWLYNTEGNQDAAMQLLLADKKRLEEELQVLRSDRHSQLYAEITGRNLELLNQATAYLANRKWAHYLAME